MDADVGRSPTGSKQEVDHHHLPARFIRSHRGCRAANLVATRFSMTPTLDSSKDRKKPVSLLFQGLFKSAGY